MSTYGIGADISRGEWSAIGRELIRKGLLAQSEGEFATIELTAEGRAALIARTPIHLTRRAGPVRSAEKKSRGDSDFGYDELLFEKLRQLRRRLADERNVPPYIVFSDVSLRHMAHEYPVNQIGRAHV